HHRSCQKARHHREHPVQEPAEMDRRNGVRDTVAKMNCIKQLGQRLMAKAFDRQVAEVQVRVAILNRFTALGTPITAAVA
ncbi:hypothetical protein ACFFJM_15255, partial [Falsigemmobacter intermedius]